MTESALVLTEEEWRALQRIAAHFLRCDYAGFERAPHDLANRILEETR